MSPTFTGSSKSAIWCFKCSDVIEIRNEIMFNFHTGLPHVNGVERVVLCEFERLLSFSSTRSWRGEYTRPGCHYVYQLYILKVGPTDWH